jgi:hypothetical protein
MSLQFSTAFRNAMLDTFETTVGTSAKLQIWTGAKPADCATASSGTKLLEYSLASDWMAAASGGAKAFSGLPATVAAIASGTTGYFRVLDSSGATTHLQGTVTATGGGGDMTVDNTNVANGQNVNLNAFTLTGPGA